MRLTYPRRGWAELSWTEDEELSTSITLDITELADMPGCDLREGALEVPRSVWNLEAWHRLYEYAQNKVFYDRILLFAGDGFVPREPLYEHQTVAADFLVSYGGGICADQMGLGKTRTAIVAAEQLGFGDPHRHRLVLGPKYTRAVWRNELLATGAIESEDEFWYAEGRDPTQRPINWDAKWFFVHFDIVLDWSSFLMFGPSGKKPIVAIIDELHWLKNGRAKRSQGAQALAGTAPHRIGLTGTPLPNRPAELWWPLTIIDGKRAWGSPVDFRRRYAGATFRDHFGGYEDGKPTHVEELRERLKTRYIRRTIDDAGVKLPKLTRQLLHVDLSDKDRERYDTLVKGLGGRDNLVQAVLERRAGKDTLAAITKLRKLTSKAKAATTLDYAKAALNGGDSIVIGTWQRATALRLQRILEHEWWAEREDDLICVAVTGQDDQDRRDYLVQGFQDLGGVLITTIDALKEGVTLTKARHIVMHDLSWVPTDILQFEARAYRIGQDKPVLSTWVVVEDSIDVLFAATLAGKSNVMSEMLGITAAQEAVEELGLDGFVTASTVEADIQRLLEALE